PVPCGLTPATPPAEGAGVRPHGRDHAEEPACRRAPAGGALGPVGVGHSHQRLELVAAAGAAILVERHAPSPSSARAETSRSARRSRPGAAETPALPAGPDARHRGPGF